MRRRCGQRRAAILLPYRLHRAGTTAEAVAEAESSGTPGTPVTDVTVSGENLVVTYARHREHAPPAPRRHGGGPARPMPAIRPKLRAGRAQRFAHGRPRLIRAAINAVVPPWARAGDETPIPGPKLTNAPSGGGGVDQTARTAAAAAQAEIDAHEGTPHNTDATARAAGGRRARHGGRCADGGGDGTGCHCCPMNAPRTTRTARPERRRRRHRLAP